MELVIFLLIVYGITNIIVNESIFDKFVDSFKDYEKIYQLLNCPTCLSFYIGVILYILIGLDISGYWFIDWFLAGVMSSGFVNILENIKIKFLE